MIKLIQLNFLFLFPSPTVPEVARHTGNQLPTGATSLKILVAQGKFYMPRATGHPLVSNPVLYVINGDEFVELCVVT